MKYFVKHYCPKCAINKPVFDLDEKLNPICPECKTKLKRKRFKV